MLARLFTDRPVLAAVLSAVIVLAGLAALRALPVAQYPPVVPPQVQVSATYPGADAETVAQTVALPLERAINGVDRALYLQSQVSDGALSLSVTFAIGTNPDQAAINVSNRVQEVTNSLPGEVQRAGIQVTKSSNTLLAIVSLGAPDRRYNDLFLNDYARNAVIDALKRVPGVGQASFFAEKDYAMRVWLRPDKLAQFRLTASDVTAAIRAQNGQFATGTVNGPPDRGGAFTYGMTTRGTLPDVAAFGDIALASGPDGASLRLHDVARVELGSEHYDFSAVEDGGPAMPIGVFLQPGGNALRTMAAVRARMAELARGFPPGMTYAYPYDTTRFVQASMREALATFGEALLLVALVVLLFLRSPRAAVIPLVAVPVSVVGTFAGMWALGLSINLLTLFGLILAIGIVVDDAIVVVENATRLMEAERLPAPEATRRAMAEVTGPVIATVLVLAAVFVPVAFQGGLTGQLYRQFAVTISVAVAISGFVALTLTPALCARLLRPRPPARRGSFAARAGRVGSAVANGYAAGVGWLLRRPLPGLALFALAGAILLVLRLPAALVPEEDQGTVFVTWSLQPAAALSRTEAVMARVDQTLRRDPAVAGSLAFSGYNQLSNGSQTNAGVAFVQLRDWRERGGPGGDARSLTHAFTAALGSVKDAQVASFNPPAIDGLGNVGGFELHIEDERGAGTAALMAATKGFLAAAAARPELSGLTTTLQADTPRYDVEVDRDRAQALGIPISAVYEAIQSTFGSFYVNDFTLHGTNYHVDLQSDAEFRASPDSTRQVFVRTAGGDMVPLAVLVRMRRVAGADGLERFDVHPSAQVTGNAAPGYTSGQAIAAVQALARTALPSGFAIAWAGSAYQEIATGGSGAQALLLGAIMVALILAAQFESWRLPFAVLLATPFAFLGALAAVWARGGADDIYVQVGLVTLVGLSAKNAVLIVQFAALRSAAGESPAAAALAAARLRLRPIVMTSVCFILGCLPLALSTGAGAGGRRSIGTAVTGGMVGVTVLGTLLVPLLYALTMPRSARRNGMDLAALAANGLGRPARAQAGRRRREQETWE